MAEVSQADQYSLASQIERSEQRIARQRQIVEDLVKFRAEGPALNLLQLMEQTLESLREQARLQQLPVAATEPVATMPTASTADAPQREPESAAAE